MWSEVGLYCLEGTDPLPDCKRARDYTLLLRVLWSKLSASFRTQVQAGLGSVLELGHKLLSFSFSHPEICCIWFVAPDYVTLLVGGKLISLLYSEKGRMCSVLFVLISWHLWKCISPVIFHNCTINYFCKCAVF